MGRLRLRTSVTSMFLLMGIATVPDIAQSFELVRGSLSGSGGQSSGGTFSARTTTSQPDAGVSGGGPFALSGGIAEGDPADCFVLAVASGLVASEGFCPGVRLNWIDNSAHETGYRIWRNTIPIAITAPSATVYDDSTAVPGVVYSYAVVTANACGDANPSGADAGHRPLDPLPPENVGITGVQIIPDSLVVSLVWDDTSADEVAQIVYRAGGTPTAVKTLPPNVEATDVVIPTQGAAQVCFAVAAANCALEARSDTVCVVVVGVTVEQSILLPTAFALGQIVPNPSHGRAVISFDVPRRAALSLRIYDLGGRLVRTLKDGTMDAGRHSIEWDGRHDTRATAGSGIYFVELRAPGFRVVGRITLLN